MMQATVYYADGTVEMATVRQIATPDKRKVVDND